MSLARGAGPIPKVAFSLTQLNHFTRHSRMPPEKLGLSLTESRMAVVPTESNVVVLKRSFATSYAEGLVTGFHSPLDLMSTCQVAGTRHWPLPVSSNQYTSTALSLRGWSKSYSTHSSVPLWSHQVKRGMDWSPLELGRMPSLRAAVVSFSKQC